MNEEAIVLLGKRAKLDATKPLNLPLLINESWGSDILKKAYKDRLSSPEVVTKIYKKG